MEPGEEWLRRRNRRHKEQNSTWRLIKRIIALIVVIFMIKLFSSDLPDRFFDYLTERHHSTPHITIEGEK